MAESNWLAGNDGTNPLLGIEIPEIIFDTEKNKTYERGGLLGKADFGTKYYVVTCTETKDVFACKVVDKRILNTRLYSWDKLAAEIEIHRTLIHEHILGYHSHFEDDDHIYIILEHFAHESLFELLKRRRSISELEARYFLRQILLAVDYLQENRVVHRNLKLGTVFIKSDSSIKLGEFGLATRIEVNGERRKTLCGTPNYIAPEVLEKRGHGFEVAIWSVGCILYALLVGKLPFETSTLKRTYSKIKRGDYDIPVNNASHEAKNLIVEILLVDPYLRPTAKQILHHKFFTGSLIPASLSFSFMTLESKFDKENNTAGSSLPQIEYNFMGTGCSQQANAALALLENLEVVINFLLELKYIDSHDARHLKIPASDDVSEDPKSSEPWHFIAKWTTHSEMNGFEYWLEYFVYKNSKNLMRMISLPNGNNFQYVNSKYYLVQVSGQTHEAAIFTRLPNMYTWFMTYDAIVMVLSNGTMQIETFLDGSKMILCPLLGTITIMKPGEPNRTYKFELIKKFGCTFDMREKLKYALEKVKEVIRSKKSQVIANHLRFHMMR